MTWPDQTGRWWTWTSFWVNTLLSVPGGGDNMFYEELLTMPAPPIQHLTLWKGRVNMNSPEWEIYWLPNPDHNSQIKVDSQVDNWAGKQNQSERKLSLPDLNGIDVAVREMREDENKRAKESRSIQSNATLGLWTWSSMPPLYPHNSNKGAILPTTAEDHAQQFHQAISYTHTVILSHTVVYCRMLPYTGVYCRILPYTVVYCHILPYTVIYCRILPYTVIYCHILSYTVIYCHILSYTVAYCHILSYTVIYCRILSYTVICCRILSYTVIYCHILSYTVAYCRMLLYTVVYYRILPCTVK
jgi:hypothetical protein